MHIIIIHTNRTDRKDSNRRIYLLVAIKSNIYCAQREADNLLAKYYRKTNQAENQGRKKDSLIYNYFSTYAEALPIDNPTTINQPIHYISSSYHRLITTSFTNNNNSKMTSNHHNPTNARHNTTTNP